MLVSQAVDAALSKTTKSKAAKKYITSPEITEMTMGQVLSIPLNSGNEPIAGDQEFDVPIFKHTCPIF